MSPVTIALAALALILAAVIGIEFATGGPASAGAAGKRVIPAEAKLLPPLAQMDPAQAYPETAGRPLFTPTRRPAPEAAVAAQPAFQRGQFQLVGVIVAGNTRTAMLKEKTSGRVHRVEVGKDINGIKVSQIEKDSVLLAQGAETETVGLSVQKPAGPGQPGAAAAAAGAQGPFGAPGGGNARMPPTMTAAPPGPPNLGFPTQASPSQPGAPMPMQSNVPGGMPVQVPQPGNAAGAPVPDAALTPEEILARRRQRRAQQNQ